MKNSIPLLNRGKVSQQVEREAKLLKWMLKRDEIELLFGNLTSEERFEYACQVFAINEEGAV